MTPEGREAWLNEPDDMGWYHRDGTPAKTRREGLNIAENRFSRGGVRKNPDHGRVARTRFPNGHFLSTVFLGLDHGFLFGEKPDGYVPVLFESMYFARNHESLAERRWRTEAEAKRGHRNIRNQIVLTFLWNLLARAFPLEPRQRL
jgi:hypothetical protein